MAVTIDCSNPKELLKQYKCLACLSQSQLMQLLIVVLNDYLTTLRGSEAYDLPSDTLHLLQDSACYTCLTDTQMLQIIVLFFGYLAYQDEVSIETLRDKIKCLLCDNPQQSKAAIMRLLCLLTESLALPA